MKTQKFDLTLHETPKKLVKMTTRAELTERLSSVPTNELLRLLKDETLAEITVMYFQNIEMELMTPKPIASSITVPGSITASKKSDAKAKRPLNAFMAFRSYYVKLFPDAHQKTASGFLTTLWNKDPFRNKWALIAKVYSFIRDQVGKNNVSLSDFLCYACSAMAILEPNQYLRTLCWEVRETSDGARTLIQDGSATDITAATELVLTSGPATELELLISVVQTGYLPEVGFDLIELMNTNNSGIMNSTATHLKEDFAIDKTCVAETLPQQPKHEKSLFGSAMGDFAVHLFTLDAYQPPSYNPEGVDTLAQSMEHGLYNYQSSASNSFVSGEPVLCIDGLAEHKTFDVDNAWDMDRVLIYQTQDTQSTIPLTPSPPYDARENFHYTF